MCKSMYQREYSAWMGRIDAWGENDVKEFEIYRNWLDSGRRRGNPTLRIRKCRIFFDFG